MTRQSTAITIAQTFGGAIEVDCLYAEGGLAIHRNSANKDLWALTRIPSGLAIYTRFCKARHARKALKALIRVQDWTKDSETVTAIGRENKSLIGAIIEHAKDNMDWIFFEEELVERLSE
jgi:hypothetical protein